MLGAQAGRAARRWALGWARRWRWASVRAGRAGRAHGWACARLGVLGAGAAGAGAQATAARGRGARRRASGRHAGRAGKRQARGARQGAAAGAGARGAHGLGMTGRWARPGRSSWLRAVHSVHLAHFRSVLTRYFPESNFLDIVREPGS